MDRKKRFSSDVLVVRGSLSGAYMHFQPGVFEVCLLCLFNYTINNIQMKFICLFFRLSYYVNWLGGWTAGGKKQNVLKICLLTINHECDLASGEQNVHN